MAPTNRRVQLSALPAVAGEALHPKTKNPDDPPRDWADCS